MTIKLGEICAGYGGLGLGLGLLADVDTRWVADVDAGPSRILARHWPDAPNLGDITRIDWATVEPVDVIAGGTPCQDLSNAGHRAGMRPGTRSEIWEAMAHAIKEIAPNVVVWENVSGARSAAAYSRLEPGPGRLGGGGQTDLFSGLSDVWSETWPASGMTRRGSLYGLPTSEPRTGASGSSSSRGVPTLPTPSASCATGPGEHGDGGMNLQTVVARLAVRPGWSTRRRSTCGRR
jgi:gp69